MTLIRPFPAQQQVLHDKSSWFHHVVYQWLMRLGVVANLATVPYKGVVFCNLTAQDIADYFTSGLGNIGGPYHGWAICDGNNTTPPLTDLFIRSKVTGAGGTGGSDSSAHTHAIDHDHGSFTSGAEASHTHGAGSLTAAVRFSDAQEEIYIKHAGSGFTASEQAALTVDADGATATGSGAEVYGTSAAGSSHTHSVDVPALTGTSGAASATENRPAYYELVPLMRLEIV